MSALAEIRQIDYTVIFARDMAAMRHFYGTVLGFPGNTKKNEHYFCRHCGVRAFGIGTETPIGKMYGVNIGCLAGVSEEALSRLQITCVDGLNDRQGAPEFCSHL